MKRAVLITIVSFCAALPGSATEFWVSYDASSGMWPESLGWTRVISGGGDIRYFEDGALVLDGQSGWDAYWWSLDGLGPEAGEVFIARWSLCVSEVVPAHLSDPLVSVNSDLQTGLLMYYGYEYVGVDGLHIAYEPGIFHEYELRTPDMSYYELYLDNTLAQSGVFHGVAGPPLIGWGDGFLYTGSVSRWRYFSFGVVPEPCALWSLLLAGAMRLRR